MAKPGLAPKLYFVQMSKAFLKVDPFNCMLCGTKMIHGSNQWDDGKGASDTCLLNCADEVSETVRKLRCVRGVGLELKNQLSIRELQ